MPRHWRRSLSKTCNAATFTRWRRRRRWDACFLHVRKYPEKQACELTILRADGTQFDAALDYARANTEGAPTVRVALTDISERRLRDDAVRKAEEERIEALDAGADDYVTKPFSMPELSARIRANLRRVPSASHAGAQAVRFGNVSVDLATHHLSMSGADVRLTPKQFDVLAYLIENPNVSIPHARLLQAVWGPDYRDEVEYLHVVVNQLRKRIEVDPSHPRYIITEPWFGYRFQLPDDVDKRAE